MRSEIGTLLTDPWSFFERDEATSLAGPVVVVVGSSLVSSVGSVVALAEFGSGFPGGVLLLAAFSVISGITGGFVSWAVYTVIFYGLSALVGGEGSLVDLFALIGWGFLPQLLAAVLVLVGSLAYVWWLGIVIYGVSTLWSIYIWVAAVEQSRGLSRLRAVATVATPVVLTAPLFVLGVIVAGG